MYFDPPQIKSRILFLCVDGNRNLVWIDKTGDVHVLY